MTRFEYIMLMFLGAGLIELSMHLDGFQFFASFGGGMCLGCGIGGFIASLRGE